MTKVSIDVTVVCLPSFNSLGASKEFSLTATRAAKKQISAIEPICQTAGLLCQPVAFKTGSGISISPMLFLQSPLSGCALIPFEPPPQVCLQLMQNPRLKVQVAKVNMIFNGAPSSDYSRFGTIIFSSISKHLLNRCCTNNLILAETSNEPSCQ